jgi:hypothetical protein
MLSRPDADELAPYYGRYISLVPEGDVRDHMRTQLHETIALLSGVGDARGEQAYGAGKWTLKEVLQHMADTERVMTYRLLRISRGDKTPLAGFEQDEWMPHACANRRSMANLAMEFSAIRAATLLLMDAMPDEAWGRVGTASGHSVSARALAYICAGHERHHVAVIRERYLNMGDQL